MKETEAPCRWYHRLMPASKADIKRIERLIIMKASELQPRLDALNAKVTTIGTEIAALRASLADVDLPADAEASLVKLEGLVQADVDAAAPTATPPPA